MENRKHEREWNKDVPAETQLRYMCVEFGKLKAEIDHLQHEIEWRDEAIREFKKWQKKAIVYKMDYWFNEGLKLMEESYEERKYRAMYKLIKHNQLFRSRLKTLQKQINQIDAARGILRQYLGIETTNDVKEDENDNDE